MKKKAALFIATFGFIGYFPLAPGTWGSLAGLLLTVGLSETPALFYAVFASCLAAGLWSCGYARAVFGAADPRPVVIDEVCGMMCVFCFVPVTLATLALGFAGFRCADIVKPLGMRRLERLRPPWGIMCDDLAAGGLVGMILWLARRLGVL